MFFCFEDKIKTQNSKVLFHKITFLCFDGLSNGPPNAPDGPSNGPDGPPNGSDGPPNGPDGGAGDRRLRPG